MRLKPLASLSVLIAIRYSDVMGFAQNEPTAWEIRPKLNAAIDLRPRVGFQNWGELQDGVNYSFNRWRTGALITFRMKPILNLHDIDEDREHYIVLASGYEYLHTVQNGSTKNENRIICEMTPQILLAGLLFTNRNRTEFRWINSVYDFRYRNRLTLSHRFQAPFRFTPYGSGEVVYDRNDHAWNRSQYGFGVQFPYKNRLRHLRLASELHFMQPESRERARDNAKPLFQQCSVAGLTHMKRIAVCLITVLMTGFVSLQAGRSTVQTDGQNVLWSDPGDVASLNFKYGVGGSEGQPEPPFQFVNEDTSGTSPKINVTDNRGVHWNVKWGHEPSASTFCSRLLWACGYFAEIEYFVPQGRIEDIHNLERARSHVSKDGSFVKARFQLRSGTPKYLKGQHWRWEKNPFKGTRELKGLKILLLLVSNWDTKEKNLSIFEDNSSGQTRYLYVDDDWGASLGKWGNAFTWSKWDCDGFAKQTRSFVRNENGSLHWGFQGKNQKEIVSDITVQDVQWLLQYLGRISDDQIQAGLAASGAAPENIGCFAQALRERIRQLQNLSNR